MQEWQHESPEVLQQAARSRQSQECQAVLQGPRLVPVRRRPPVMGVRVPRDPLLAWDRPVLGLLHDVAQRHRQGRQRHCRRHPDLRLVHVLVLP